MPTRTIPGHAHRLAAADAVLMLAIAHRRVELDDPAQVAGAIAW